VLYEQIIMFLARIKHVIFPKTDSAQNKAFRKM